jgi:chromosome segregation ATPase
LFIALYWVTILVGTKPEEGMMTFEEEVHAACDTIRGRGEIPTLKRIREQIGGASPNRVQPFLVTWREKRAAQAAQPQEAPELSENGALVPLVPPAVAAALEGLTTAIRTTITLTEDRERAAARSTIENINRQLQDTQREAAEHAEAAASDIATLSAEQEETAQLLADKTDELERTQADRAMVAAERTEIMAERDRLAQQVEILQHDLAGITKERDAQLARAEAAEGEARSLEALAADQTGQLRDVRQSLEDVRQQLDASRTRETQAREEAAAARQVAEQREAEVQASRAQIESFRTERDLARDEVREARQAEAQARERAATAEARVEAATTAAAAAEQRAKDALAQLTTLAASVKPAAPSEASSKGTAKKG